MRWRGKLREMASRRAVTVSILLVLGAAPARSDWQTYTVADGLVSDYVSGVVEDRHGAIWLSTTRGISRFDGTSWRTYTTADGLAHDYIYAFAQDAAGNLWAGTDLGVSCFDGAAWRTYTTADGLANDRVRAICSDRLGSVWFGTEAGLSRFDGSQWRTFGAADGLDQTSIRAIVEDREANLWFGGTRGVTRFDGTTWRTFTVEEGVPRGGVSALAIDEFGDLWVGALEGLSRFDGAAWTSYASGPGGLVSQQVTSICVDRFGWVWVGTARGVSRHGGGKWRTYTKADGLGGDWVLSIFQDRVGSVWFGTLGGGASRKDGGSCKTWTESNGLAGNVVYDILEDHDGNLWFGGWHGASRHDGVNWTIYNQWNGLSVEVEAMFEDRAGNLWFGVPNGANRFDGTSWDYFSPPDGLPGDYVRAIHVDRTGTLWIGTDTHGAFRHDGMAWQAIPGSEYMVWIRAILEDRSGRVWFGGSGSVAWVDSSGWTPAQALLGMEVRALLEDRSGDLWFATERGVVRYDGQTIRTYTVADGLVGDDAYALTEDRLGHIWVGTTAGASRYDGVCWGTFTVGDGLTGRHVLAIEEDALGQIWFGTSGQGVTQHEPDRVAPRVAFVPVPPPLSSSTTQTITYGVVLGEAAGVKFSCSLDGSTWSAWSSVDYWRGENLADGMHHFTVRARDEIGNLDSTGVTCGFEIDATPPAAVIASPAYGQAIRDSVTIVGTAADPRFRSYALQARPTAGSSTWMTLSASLQPVLNGPLGGWGTRSVPDGTYELKLAVTDALGLTGLSSLVVVVDNEPPWVYETTPVLIRSRDGGDVYTTNAGLHLYFPPHCFDRDVQVTIAPVADSLVPDVLPNGARIVRAPHDLAWGPGRIEKPATLEVSTAGLELGGPGERLALYSVAPADAARDSSWHRVGGTVDPDTKNVSAYLTGPGVYALFAEQAGGESGVGRARLALVSVIPRVFSPQGAFADDHVAIAFELSAASPVTVRVYNRAGRLVRRVVSGATMNRGANVVRWNGRDEGGEAVQGGLYVVAVEALGRTETMSVAVVR